MTKGHSVHKNKGFGPQTPENDENDENGVCHARKDPVWLKTLFFALLTRLLFLHLESKSLPQKMYRALWGAAMGPLSASFWGRGLDLTLAAAKPGRPGVHSGRLT